MPSSVIIRQIELPAKVEDFGPARVMRPLVILIDQDLLALALARDATAANTITADLLTAIKAEHADNWTNPRRR